MTGFGTTMGRGAVALAMAAGMLAGAGCESDGGGDASADASDVAATPDVGPAPDTAGPEPDAAPDAAPDTPDPPDPTGPVDPALCDSEGFVGGGDVYFGPAFGGQLVHQEIANAADGSQDVLQLSMFPGPRGGANGPGTFTLGTDDPGTCGNCVTFFETCTQADGCLRSYEAVQGVLEITSWQEGGTFEATISNVLMKETDERNGIVSFVDDGLGWCLESRTFTGVMPESTYDPGVAKPSCQPGGTGVLQSYNIQDISYTNCLGETVNLHDTCGQERALWVMGTAGWCTACTARLKQLSDAHGGSLSRQLVRDQTPGLDLLIVLVENNAGNMPTEAFCMQYAESRNLDPAMVVLDHDPQGVNVPILDPPGTGINAKGFAKTWKAINPYLVAGDGGVGYGVPWNAVLDSRNMAYVWSDYVSESSIAYEINKLLAD